MHGHYPGRVPQITEPINGIEIFMYVAPKEHPPPHFHAIDGEDEAQISIATLEGSRAVFALADTSWSGTGLKITRQICRNAGAERCPASTLAV